MSKSVSNLLYILFSIFTFLSSLNFVYVINIPIHYMSRANIQDCFKMQFFTIYYGFPTTFKEFKVVNLLVLIKNYVSLPRNTPFQSCVFYYPCLRQHRLFNKCDISAVP